jgi:hypothetical protein
MDQKNKLLEIKEYSLRIINIIDDLLLITKNKGIKKINQSINSSSGSDILQKYNKEGYKTLEVIPTEEKYKIVETIKEAEKKGNWNLVASLVGLLLSSKSSPKDSKKHKPPIKPLEMQYTSTAGEHNDKYNDNVFNDATIENLTMNEILEDPKALLFDADLKAQKKKLKRTNKPLLFDADLKAQKNKLKPAVVKPLLFDADLKAQKRRLKKTKEDPEEIAKIEEHLIPWWDVKRIKKLQIKADEKNELLEMIEKLENTNIDEIDKTKEKQINKKIKQIEKFINKPELKESKIKIKEREPKKEKKTKTVYDPKKIEKNKQLINDYTFNDKMSDRFLLDGAKALFKLQKNKGTDEDVSEFSIVYLQKEPTTDEIEEYRELFKIKRK